MVIPNHAVELPFLFKKLLGAMSGRREVVLELLLWMGASVHARDSNKRTSLHLACESDQ